MIEQEVRKLLLASLVLGCVLGLVQNTVQGEESTALIEQFENEIRPLLIDHCIECHQQDNDSGSLVINSRESLIKGGDSGPAIQPGDPERSLLIQAVHRSGELKMPPDEPLNDRQKQALVQWVKAGAVWPEKSPPLAITVHQNALKHWAFQQVVQPKVPSFPGNNWIRNPIDAFILQKLTSNELKPSPMADSRTLIRRVSYTLTGLPPTAEQIETIAKDFSAKSYEEQVDKLLASEHYGEQWARHWLDVARYSDTKGYVYAREERFWPHAWVYRDWVVDALNSDMPYDRFLLLQLAADQVEDSQRQDLAAMGFLTLGRRFLGVNHLIQDDRIDVVTRGTMGLTVGCARCHDHKYDPIPTADYYSLFGVFNNSAENLVRLSAPGTESEEFEAELKKRIELQATKLAESRTEASNRARSRVREYLIAQTELQKYPPKGFDQIFSKSDLLPAFVWKWERYLDAAKRNNDPIFIPWHRYADLNQESFVEQAEIVTAELHKASSVEMNSLVLARFETPPASFVEVINRYADLFEEVRDAALKESFPGAFENHEQEEIRKILFSEFSPCFIPDEPIVHTEFFFDSSTTTQLWKLQGEVDRWIVNSKRNVPFALAMTDTVAPSDPQIFIRGNPVNAGRVVPRQFLSILSGENRQPFKTGSGRYELAQHIIDPKNPLTARVIVNRVWTHHFGQGLVSTPSDFGTRAETPSHPELLDWLTHRFIENGWSLKNLHRLILTSATYQQRSQFAETDIAQRAVKVDPENRLLSRMNSHRQTFEEFRDSLLSVSGELQLDLKGKPKDLFAPPFPKRRTLYGRVDRQYLPGTLRVFDFANPDLHIPKRSETTVPQQALFYLNHPMVLEQVRMLANSVSEKKTAEEKITALFQRTLLRPPTSDELAESLAFVASNEKVDQPIPPVTAKDWSYGFGKFDEEQKQVVGFTPLPHYTGDAWQGGDKWPDPKLGWVQLTSTGGHPGNTREKAAIRRWTAPRDGNFSVTTKLTHEAAPGDGIRAFIVSSSEGLLASAVVHQTHAEPGIDSVSLKKGETLDFVVDIKDVLNSDQYLWSVDIQEKISESATTWNSVADFTPKEFDLLTSWEQLAHLLICTNEFLFID
ncbi:PSD1 and planctomycete cytochrome C domain-containing protein [Thalassoglobus polymorphus]|uniref:Planctomycete cytochrome C n=1 Tax=Thalassoglobus polymorphus TaxID=2527994 RepID=A0A517QNT7_9PLAN|nr:PSD1 and planctomycete cytochrome C domain-containing protein [Thalassoglobus polymorphus]QDT33293.1 Planctomycete cytochrome C [Thalassoglobus polymorphus]